MYLDYWGLRRKPFPDGLDPRDYVASPTHEEASARLHFLVDTQRRLGLLLSPAGCGKSLLLEVFGRQLRHAACQVAKVSVLGLEAAEVLWKLAADWGLNPQPAACAQELRRAIGDCLAENHWQALRTVALFDDADEADAGVLGQLEWLSRLAQANETQLTLVAAARSERISCLGRRLLELADLRIDLVPWDLDDATHFVVESLRRAGRKGPAFTRDALVRLHELSGGAVRRLSQLADLALVAAAGSELPAVDPHTIESVDDELGIEGGARGEVAGARGERLGAKG